GRGLVEVVDVSLSHEARNLSAGAASPCGKLGHPCDGPQPEPERREEPVEDDERGAEGGVPHAPPPARHRRLRLHDAPTAAASALRRATSWMIRCEISSIESSLTSSTGQPSRRCTCAAY